MMSRMSSSETTWVTLCVLSLPYCLPLETLGCPRKVTSLREAKTWYSGHCLKKRLLKGSLDHEESEVKSYNARPPGPCCSVLHGSSVYSEEHTGTCVFRVHHSHVSAWDICSSLST